MMEHGGRMQSFVASSRTLPQIERAAGRGVCRRTAEQKEEGRERFEVRWAVKEAVMLDNDGLARYGRLLDVCSVQDPHVIKKAAEAQASTMGLSRASRTGMHVSNRGINPYGEAIEKEIRQ